MNFTTNFNDADAENRVLEIKPVSDTVVVVGNKVSTISHCPKVFSFSKVFGGGGHRILRLGLGLGFALTLRLGLGLGFGFARQRTGRLQLNLDRLRCVDHWEMRGEELLRTAAV